MLLHPVKILCCSYGQRRSLRSRLEWHEGLNSPVMMGNFGFHLSRSISPSRDTLSRNRGRREVEDSSLWETYTFIHSYKHTYNLTSTPDFYKNICIAPLLAFFTGNSSSVTDSWLTRPEPLSMTWVFIIRTALVKNKFPYFNSAVLYLQKWFNAWLHFTLNWLASHVSISLKTWD